LAEAFKKMVNGAFFQMNKEDQEAMSERELFMPVENLLLIATDLGYAACPVGGFEADKYSKILDIPKNLKPIVVVPVGIPIDEPRPKFRFSDEEVFF
jgi:nitroreductase